MRTEIRIKRPDGQIEIVEKPGTFSLAMQAKMEAATRAAGRGQIIQFVTVGTAPAAGRGRWERGQRCKGCGRIGDDGECGRGNY